MRNLKRRIHRNVWDNWNGYIGNEKVIEFGSDDVAAREWLKKDRSLELEKALAELTPNIIARMDLYGIGRPDESEEIPGAAMLTREEWRALKVVIDFARQ